MKKIFIAAMSLVAGAAFADTALSQKDIDAIKARATVIANAGRTQAPAITADGQVAIDPKTGQPVQGIPGTASVQDQGRLFNSITGVTDYRNTAEPGRGGGAAASVNASSFADFSCTASPGRRLSVVGRVVKFNGCVKANNDQVSGAYIQVCSATLKGGTCADADFTANQLYPVDQFAAAGDVQVGVGCNNTTRVCRVTLNANYALVTDGTSLANQGAAQAAQAGPNSAQGTLGSMYGSTAYTEKMATTGTAVNACAGTVQDAVNRTGSASTCDGEKTVTFTGAGSSTGSGRTCSDTPVCIRKATNTVNFTQSCTRNNSLTGYLCDYTVPKQECTITKDVASSVKTSSCDSLDMAGSTKVDATDSSPTCSSTDPVTGACKTQTWMEYYTFPGKATLSGNCSASPRPLAGSPALSCVNKGGGIPAACQSGGWWRRTLSDQECITSSLSKDANGNTVESITQLTYNEKPGCGVCLAPTTSDTCYAQPSSGGGSDSCSAIDTSVCSLQSTSAESSYMGLTMSQQETYSCTKSEDTCVEYDRSNMCSTTDVAHGTDTVPTTQKTSAGLNQAMASAAVIDAINQSAQEGADPSVPRIFQGKDSRCTRPTGFFTGLFADDCCRTDMARPSGNSNDKCSLDEFKLSQARKSNQTVYIGSYCSKHRGWGPFKTCIQDTQTYCAFTGILPRVIQTQGRQQLQKMAKSSFGATLQETALSFNYYRGSGGWNPAVTVNGVSVAAWSYPSYCSDAASATAALTANPNGLECPAVLTQWFAACDNPSGCGALPDAPELGSNTWVTANVDPLKNVTNAVSQYAIVEGACDPATTSCKYTVSAWPAGVGGKAVVSRPLDFPLYSAQAQDTKTMNVPDDITNAGDLLFRPNSINGAASTAGELPAAVLLDYSLNGGVTFMHANIPTKIDGTDYVLPNTNDVRITGSCDVATNMCHYRVTGTVTVTEKPWGTAQNPDCSGFTLGQLSVLDFSSMDLSEWLASVTGNLNLPNAGDMGSLAAARSQALVDAQKNGGTVSANSPTSAVVATLTPPQEFGPYSATLKVAGNWPETYPDASKNVDPITGVDVDWGDCGMKETVAPVNGYQNGVALTGFQGQHVYVAPDKIPMACGGGAHNVTHTVHLTVYSKSGAHTVSLQTINLWDRYTNVGNGAGGTGGTVGVPATSPVPGK